MVRAADQPSPLTANDTDKWKLLDRIADAYRPLFSEALATTFDADGLAAAWAEVAPAQLQAATGDDPIDKAVAGFLEDVTGDSTAVGDVFDRMVTEGYIAATDTTPGGENMPWSGRVDWDTWQPGDALSAGELIGAEGQGLRALLDDAGVEIKSIEDTSIDLLGRVLGDGVRNGKTTDEIADDIRAMLTNPERAEMIVRTELSRAETVSTLDTFAEAGIEKYDILAEADACETCVAAVEAGPYDIDDAAGMSPFHPNCRCVTIQHIPADD